MHPLRWTPEEHFPRVLAEFRRVLKPQGRLVLVNMAPARHWGYALWARLYRANPAWVGGCRGVDLAGSELILAVKGPPRARRRAPITLGRVVVS